MRSDKEKNETGSRRLWFASLTMLEELGKGFLSQWGKTVKTFEDEAVHDLRVASRRLREGIALFSPCFPEGALGTAAKRVKESTRAMGALRNLDEALLFFSGLDETERSGCGPETARLVALVGEERKEALAELKKELSPAARKRVRRSLKKGAGLLDPFSPAAADPFTPFATFSAGALSERAEAIFELLPMAAVETDITSQHKLRIAVKKMRYRTEILAPLLDDGAEVMREALKNYQDLLGKLHDVDVFSGMVRERLSDGEGREELLRVMQVRRKELFARFIDLTKDVPLLPLVQQTEEALQKPQDL